MFDSKFKCLFEHEFMNMNLLGYTYQRFNSGYNKELVNKQCNAGDPLETSGGLYRGPPSMLIYVKAKMYAISSDTHQLQFLKLHHFKLERI